MATPATAAAAPTAPKAGCVETSRDAPHQSGGHGRDDSGRLSHNYTNPAPSPNPHPKTQTAPLNAPRGPAQGKGASTQRRWRPLSYAQITATQPRPTIDRSKSFVNTQDPGKPIVTASTSATKPSWTRPPQGINTSTAHPNRSLSKQPNRRTNRSSQQITPSNQDQPQSSNKPKRKAKRRRAMTAKPGNPDYVPPHLRHRGKSATPNGTATNGAQDDGPPKTLTANQNASEKKPKYDAPENATPLATVPSLSEPLADSTTNPPDSRRIQQVFPAPVVEPVSKSAAPVPKRTPWKLDEKRRCPTAGAAPQSPLTPPSSSLDNKPNGKPSTDIIELLDQNGWNLDPEIIQKQREALCAKEASGETPACDDKPGSKGKQPISYEEHNGWNQPSPQENSKWNRRSSQPPKFAWKEPPQASSSWNPAQTANGAGLNQNGNRWAPNGNNQNGGNRGWAKRPPRKTQWIKQRDLKPVPIDEEDEEDGGFEIESNSHGDPDYDIRKLVDWNGDWLPPPLEWENRGSFTDRKFGDRMEAWITQTDKYNTIRVKTDHPDFLNEVTGDIAPHHWVPTNIEGDSPQQFWRTYLSRAPVPHDEGDLDEQPWWEKYKARNSCFLVPLKVPEAHPNPQDEDYHLFKKHLPAIEAIQKMHNDRMEKHRKIIEKRRKKAAKAATRVTVDEHIHYEEEDRKLYPTARIYIRPAYLQDVGQITDIYNHWLKDSFKTPEFLERTRAQMRERVNSCKESGLPWIVAIERGSDAQYIVRQQNYTKEEKVVGFACLDDYFDIGSMYRFTYELELFVHSEYLRRGVGKCLLDRLLYLVDTGYKVHGGPDWFFRNEYLQYGATRMIKTINCSIPHENGDDTEMEWLTPLFKFFGFRKSGHLHNMGVKNGKIVDISIFQYITSEVPSLQNPTSNLL